MSITRPRILIADDHTLIADLCRKLLETDFEVVGIVDNGRAMVRTEAGRDSCRHHDAGSEWAGCRPADKRDIAGGQAHISP
jgi:hypothetical protein